LAGELIRFFNDVIVALEERQNIFNSTLHVVEVMRAGHPARCLLELDKDEIEKAFDMGREHMEALITAAALPVA
jgi:c-di-GMP-related signal transduction protein